MKFIKHALLDMSVSKILLYYFSLWLLLALCATSCHAQTVDVGAFKESTLGAKLADAQTNGCALDSNVRCVLVLKPELNVFPLGTMPTRCARCVWLDWTGGGLPFGSASYSPTINGVPLQIPGTSFVLGMNHPGFDFSTYALGYPTITTLPLIAGSNTATFAPCPYGMSDTSGGLVPIPMNVHDLGAGSDEVVTVSLLSAGTPGSPLCTVTFTAANPHTLWSLQSATGGVQEAVNDNTTLAIWIRSKGTGFKAPVTTVTTSIYGSGEESALINGDPGNNPLLAVSTTPAFTGKVHVSGFACSNSHSTVTDIKENCMRIISSAHVEVDHVLAIAGSGGILVTSFGGGGLTNDVYVHHVTCRSPLNDFCVQVNGDGGTGVSSDVHIEYIFSGDLGSGAVSNSPRHDVYVEDCTRCHMKHLYLELDGGFVGANDTAISDSANHAASVADDTWDDVQAHDNGGFTGFAVGMQSNKTYNGLTLSNSTFDGFGGAISCGQTYSAANQLNHVVFRNLDFPNTQNSGADGVTCGVTGGTAFDEDLLVDNVNVTGTGAGTSLRGFHFIQMNSITVRNSSAIGVATHCFDFEGVSKSTIALNFGLNCGKTATGDGFLVNTNAGVVSDGNLFFGNHGNDTQGSPTQRYGINNNQASGSTNLLVANFFTGNLTGNIHDANNLFVYGPNASGTAAENLRVSPLRTGRSANTDQAGHLALVAGAATYTFTGTYATAPICVANDTSSAAQSGVRVTTSTTTLTLNGNATDGVNYMCFGLN